MPLQIIRNDLTKMKVDAVVNAANSSLLGGGGVDGMIHAAAGPDLLEACRKLNGCRPGEAKITPGFKLPARYVIHTVGPIWQGGTQGEAETLADCYRHSLDLAAERKLRSVAFPLISTGAYGYPKAEALRIAVDTIAAWLLDSGDMTVYLVVFSRDAYEVSSKLFSDVRALIDDAYAGKHADNRSERRRYLEEAKSASPNMGYGMPPMGAPMPQVTGKETTPKKRPDWAELLRRTDEGFAGMLLRKIDESGMTDAACYKKANIDRRVFSKIRSNPFYKPSKATACAFALALELPEKEAEELLAKAGFALSPSQPFDIVLRYCISHGVYNVFEVNEVLFQYDLPLLGG